MTWQARLPGPEEIQFTAWPRKATLDDYARAIDEVVGGLHKLRKSASIYQFGKVGVPGISDLDFVVVLDDKEPGIGLNRWEALKRSFSPMTRYILMHRPLVVSSTLWPSFAAANPFTDIQHLAGPVLSPPIPDDNSSRLSQLVKRVEDFVFRPYRGLLEPVLRRQVRVRPHLKGLLALRHKAMILSLFGVERSGWAARIRDLLQLRDAWFSLDRVQQTRALHESTLACVEIESQIIEEMSGLMIRSGIVIPELQQTGMDVVGMFDDNAVFVENFNVERSHEYTVSSFEISAQLFYMVPSTFLAPFLFYIAHGPHLRRYLGDRFAVFYGLPDLAKQPPPPAIADRLKMLDQYLDFIWSHKAQWGMLFDHWTEPKKELESARVFWTGVQPHISRPSDIIALSLRRRLASAQAELAEITNSESWKATWSIRRLRNGIAPPDSRLDRIFKSLRRKLASLQSSPQAVGEE